MRLWRDWAAVGPGAHGRLTADGRRLATEAAKSPGAYVKLVAEALIGWSDPETLTLLDQARERLSMGLRVIEGIAVADIEALGFTIDRARLDELAQLGMLTAEAGRVALTRRGRLAADRVVAMISP